MRPRKQPLTDHLIQKSVDGGMNRETGHYKQFIYGPVEDQERALEIKRSLYRCAKRMGYALKADVVAVPGRPAFLVPFVAIDKRRARAYIARLYKGREHQLPYNPYQRNAQPKE